MTNEELAIYNALMRFAGRADAFVLLGTADRSQRAQMPAEQALQHIAGALATLDDTLAAIRQAAVTNPVRRSAQDQAEADHVQVHADYPDGCACQGQHGPMA